MSKLFDVAQTARYPRFVSHRGFQPLAPANSLPSFEYAAVVCNMLKDNYENIYIGKPV